MKNISVIIPIHKFNDEYNQMLDNALNSIASFYNDVKVIIVAPESELGNSNVNNIVSNLEIVLKSHNGATDFCSQVNYGIDNCDTEWFTILEVDDEFKSVWLKSMNEHMNEYKDVDIFLPIVKDINVEGKFINFTNESTWAYGFTDKQGFLDNEVLLDFQNYQISGGLYKTEIVKNNGKFKENIKLTFGYEFLLRLTHNGAKILTVPRVGYQHVNFREDSLFWNYKNDDELKLSEKESKFWLDTAKKEFFFKNKRDITYVES